jgi:glycosyltransferase involved in cell wall biosynthesis
MLIPGGLEHAGGIGRWAGYLERSWRAQALEPPLEIVDTRGHGHPGRAAAAFARALLRLIALHRERRLGVIHANLSQRGSTIRKLIVAQLARRLGVPLVIHLHGSGYHEFYDGLWPPLQRPVRAMFRGAAGVIVLGRFWAAWVADRMGLPPSSIATLYNGVPTPGGGRGQDPARPHIVLLGRIGPRKGIPELLEALASPAMASRGWRATLAGDGDLEPYRRFVAERGLADRVTLPGWLDSDAASGLLQRADILTLPSHAENFPISVIEALAAGVAVVTTPIGTTPELLVDGVSALFVPVGDAHALADTLVRLIDDAALRRRIAAAGHDVFRRELDIDALARRLAAMHAETIAAHANAS